MTRVLYALAAIFFLIALLAGYLMLKLICSSYRLHGFGAGDIYIVESYLAVIAIGCIGIAWICTWIAHLIEQYQEATQVDGCQIINVTPTRVT